MGVGGLGWRVEPRQTRRKSRRGFVPRGSFRTNPLLSLLPCKCCDPPRLAPQSHLLPCPLPAVLWPHAHPPSLSCGFAQAAASVVNTSAIFFVFFKVQIGVTSSRKPSLATLSLIFPGSPPPGRSISVLSIIGPIAGFYFSASADELWT